MDKVNQKLEVVVLEHEMGERLDRYLMQQEGISSRTIGQRLIEAGLVTLNGGPTSGAYKIKLGDVIHYELPEPIPLQALPEKGPLEIIYEDESLIVINKPPGLVVHPAPGHYTGTLVNFLLYHFEQLSVPGGLRPGLVHRIDKDTSGLLVIAKNDAVHEALSLQFQDHSIHRLYHALIWGNPLLPSGRIEGPIGRHPSDRKKMAVVEGGRHAVTHWKVLERLQWACFIQCCLETGRTHQIRVHLTSEGFPLLGDSQYGNVSNAATKTIPADLLEVLRQFPRQALHASELGFIHPVTEEEISFEVPLPDDFEGLLKQLRKSAAEFKVNSAPKRH